MRNRSMNKLTFGTVLFAASLGLGAPAQEWTDDQLLDQYRYIKAAFDGDESDYLDSDDNVAELITGDHPSRARRHRRGRCRGSHRAGAAVKGQSG